MNSKELLIAVVMSLILAHMSSRHVTLSAGYNSDMVAMASKIYKISSRPGGQGSAGTAFQAIVKGQSALITNWHVCGDSAQMYYTGLGGNGVAQVVKTDSSHDLCLLSPETENLNGFVIAEDAARFFESVVAIGYPYAEYIQPARGYVLEEIPVHLTTDPYRDDDYRLHCPKGFLLINNSLRSICALEQKVIHTTIVIYPGNSGSPVINNQGDVVGVINCLDARTMQASMIGLADLKEFLR